MIIKSSSSTLKYALFCSLILNAIALFFFAERKIEFNKRHSGAPTIDHVKNLDYFLNREDIYKLFPINSNDIVMAGDSHTQNYDIPEYLPEYKIINRGIGFDVSEGLLKRIDEIIDGKPKKLFIEIGINDLSKHIRQATTIRNIDTIITKAQTVSPATKIFVTNIFPVNLNDGYNMKDSVVTLNEKLKSLCNKRGVVYIDMYSLLNDKGYLNKQFDCGDGIHLNGKGYIVYTKALKNYL